MSPLFRLRKALYDEYGGAADKRIKKLDKAVYFAVDGRFPDGIASDGSFFSWFCSISAEINHADRVTVTLGNTIPNSPAVGQWEQAHGVARRRRVITDVLEFDVTPQDVDKLLTLRGDEGDHV
jgi:hypothetical protein